MGKHTVGALAKILGDSPARVRYAIRKAGLEARAVVSRYRLFGDEDIPAISRELQTMGRVVRPLPPGGDVR